GSPRGRCAAPARRPRRSRASRRRPGPRARRRPPSAGRLPGWGGAACGAMASVFKASRGGESCALKRPLYAFLEEPEFLERFLREAEIGRALNHPNVIRIMERGEVEGVPFFTMELLPGETLQALLERQGALRARQ